MDKLQTLLGRAGIEAAKLRQSLAVADVWPGGFDGGNVRLCVCTVYDTAARQTIVLGAYLQNDMGHRHDLTLPEYQQLRGTNERVEWRQL